MVISSQPNKGFTYALSECIGMKLSFTDTEVLKQARQQAQIRIQIPNTVTTTDGDVFTIAGVRFTKQSTGTSNYNTIVYGAGASATTVATEITTALNSNPFFTGRTTITYVTGSPNYINILFTDYEVLSNFVNIAPLTIDTVNTFNAIGYELKDGLKVIWNLYNDAGVKLTSRDEYGIIYRNNVSAQFESFIDFRYLIKLFLGLTVNNQVTCLNTTVVDAEFKKKFQVKFSVIQDSEIDCGIDYVSTGQTDVFEVGNSILDTLGTMTYSNYLFTSNAETTGTKLIKFLNIRPQDIRHCLSNTCNSLTLIANAMEKTTGATAVQYRLITASYFTGGLSSSSTTIISIQDGALQIPINLPTVPALQTLDYIEVHVVAIVSDAGGILFNRQITEKVKFYYASCDCSNELYFMNQHGAMETMLFNQFIEIDNDVTYTGVQTNESCNDGAINKLLKNGTRASDIKGKRLHRYTATEYQKKPSHIAFMQSFIASPFILATDSTGNRRRFTLTQTKFNLQATKEAGEGRELTEFIIEGYFNDALIVPNFNF